MLNVGFPQLTSPVVQMFKDLAAAHHQPASASPALQALRHHPTSSSSANSSGGGDPTLLSNVRLSFSRNCILTGRGKQPRTEHFTCTLFDPNKCA